ncbi:hypothetical protein [Nocardia jejuensis]|uniref:hypothetical protein n=1 Tax=Nocardia jejuensis TaxID=328049 RepID=UPI0008344BB0|nr:hypothetical protein [Nocardia jejuensis]
MGLERTVREIIDLVVDLGLVDLDSAAQNALLSDALDDLLDEYGDTEQSAVLEILDALGFRYTLDHKAFSGLSRCSLGERRERYNAELQMIAACTRGKLIISNVRLVDSDPDSTLQFDCNGIPQSWPVHPGDDEDEEATLTFATNLTTIPTGTVEQFCSVECSGSDLSAEAVFGDPDVLTQLGEQFGLTFEP